jgi:hypothetical protein
MRFSAHVPIGAFFLGIVFGLWLSHGHTVNLGAIFQ